MQGGHDLHKHYDDNGDDDDYWFGDIGDDDNGDDNEQWFGDIGVDVDDVNDDNLMIIVMMF